MTCFRWVALGKFPEEFVYLVVKICHRGTLPSATPSFQVGKNFENRKKHQRRRIAWVGQADFGKLELRDGPLEKLWVGRGILELQEFFFVIRFFA